MGRKKTNTEFIADSKRIHSGLFTYDKCNYINQHTKITLTCIDHGDFTISPNNHISKHVGCKKCSVRSRSHKRTLSLNEFIDRSKKIHPQYDYSLVEYVNVHTPVRIICNTHGPFSQLPTNHIYKRQGCPSCYKSSHQHTFLDNAIRVHGDTYDYSRVQYIHSNTDIIIECTKHGTFLQTPNNHLLGHGCQTCVKLYTPPSKEFWNTCYKVHNDRYTYDETNYINLSSTLHINCPIHGAFTQSASTHLKGGICPICMYRVNLGYTKVFFDTYPYKKNVPAIVYFVQLYCGNESFYKIGITIRPIQHRFRHEIYEFKLITHINTTWVQSYLIETELLQLAFKLGYKYIPTQQLNGKHECFNFTDPTTIPEQITTITNALINRN